MMHTTRKGFGGRPGRSCNFHFGYGRDLIEEDVENEKSCVQVLKFMVAKADDEIHDLEDELAILQCQLKWNESDKQDLYEATCATFKQKIDFLASSIQRLKDENGTRKHVIDEALEIQGPAERISEIINTLIRNDFLDPVDQDKQSGLTISEESSTDAIKLAAKDTKEDFMSKSDDEVPMKDGIDASRYPSEEKSVALTIKPAVAQTPLPDPQASPPERNSNLDALPQGKGEVCRTESESGESGSSALSASAVTIAIDSSFTLRDHGRDIPVGDHLKRKLHSDLGVIPQYIPTSMLKPLKVIENLESTPNSENSAQSGSFFKNERGSRFFGKTYKQKKVGDSGAKKQQIRRVKKENAILSPVSDLDSLKRKISQDPDFLKKLKVPELREIAKQNKWSGLSKSKKEQIVDEMIKHLGS